MIIRTFTSQLCEFIRNMPKNLYGGYPKNLSDSDKTRCMLFFKQYIDIQWKDKVFVDLFLF